MYTCTHIYTHPHIQVKKGHEYRLRETYERGESDDDDDSDRLLQRIYHGCDWEGENEAILP